MHALPHCSSISRYISPKEFLTVWGDLAKTGFQSLTDDEQDAKDPNRGENWGIQAKNVGTRSHRHNNSKLKEWSQLLSTFLLLVLVTIKTKNVKICFRHPHRHRIYVERKARKWQHGGRRGSLRVEGQAVTGEGWGAGCSLGSKDPVVQGGELTGAPCWLPLDLKPSRAPWGSRVQSLSASPISPSQETGFAWPP